MLPLDHDATLAHMLGRIARMNISDHGMRFIVMWESIRNEMYDDGGKGIGNATIGVGHLIHYGPIDGRAEEQPYVNGISDQEALRLFREDVQSRVDTVNDHTRVQLNQNQFDAMVDFQFNTGRYSAVVPIVNQGGDVCAAIAPYNKPFWATAALTRRRNDECALFNTPVEEEEDMPLNDDDKRTIGEIVKLKVAEVLNEQDRPLTDQQKRDVAAVVKLELATDK